MKSPESDDWQLLNAYARERSETAFRALVERYAGMVYHAALRQTRDPHAAEEVTQAVFIAFAQKAATLSQRVVIGGWLFQATRYAVLNLARTERTRKLREREAAVMQAASTTTDRPDPVWEQISPYLDEAMAALSEKDREAVIVRFFGNKSHRETGQALGVSEEAAKKRLGRALDKLRARFLKRGVMIPAVALTTALAASAAKAAPGGVAAAAATAALQHAAGTVVSAPVVAGSILTAMAQARLKVFALTTLVACLFALQTGRFVFHANKPAPLQPLAAPAVPTDPSQGRIVVWDNRLPKAPMVNANDPTLEQALDRAASEEDAYWTVDYVVYDSAQSLQRLLDTARAGNPLASAGWTNVCANVVKQSDVVVVNKNGEGAANPAAAAPSLQNLPPGAGNIVKQGARVLSMTAVLDDDAPGGSQNVAEQQQAARGAIDRAMKAGAPDGVLASERLLVDANLLPRFANLNGLMPDEASAARLAAEAHAHWTIIYSLRRSPLMMMRFTLTHQPVPESPIVDEPQLDNPVVDLDGSNRFELTLEEVQAHNQAAQNWQAQQAGKGR